MTRVLTVLILIVLSGCSSINSYEYRNHREEGYQNGMFSGGDGEFIIKGSKD